MFLILIYLAVFVIAYGGAKTFRDWSFRRDILALPNARSSHTVPTPQGGGLVIVVVCLFFYTIHSVFISENFSWSYFLGAGMIALISWLDDLFTISIIWRFLVHSLAAVIVILGLGYFQELYYPIGNFVNIGICGTILTFFWIVWVTNAYNFMDGIDGLAGIQAVVAGVGWFFAGNILGVEGTGFLGGLLAFAGLGFLTQNWHPAKLFMGDVGSVFFGFNFAVLPLLAIKEKNELQGVLLVIAVIIVWLFLWDTVLTLLRRIIRGEKIWEAHRGHIYQRIVTQGFSHKFVATLYGVISIFNLTFLLLWLMFVGGFGFILVIFILLESFGLLFFLNFVKKSSFNQKAKKL